MRREVAALAASAALAAGLLACGSDDSDDSSRDASLSTSTAVSSYSVPSTATGAGGTLAIPAGQPSLSGPLGNASQRKLALQMRFRALYQRPGDRRLVAIPGARITVKQLTNPVTTPTQTKTTDSQGYATFALKRGTRYSVEGRRGCPPSPLFLFPARPFTTPATAATASANLLFSWRRC